MKTGLYWRSGRRLPDGVELYDFVTVGPDYYLENPTDERVNPYVYYSVADFSRRWRERNSRSWDRIHAEAFQEFMIPDVETWNDANGWHRDLMDVSQMEYGERFAHLLMEQYLPSLLSGGHRLFLDNVVSIPWWPGALEALDFNPGAWKRGMNHLLSAIRGAIPGVEIIGNPGWGFPQCDLNLIENLPDNRGGNHLGKQNALLHSKPKYFMYGLCCALIYDHPYIADEAIYGQPDTGKFLEWLAKARDLGERTEKPSHAQIPEVAQFQRGVVQVNHETERGTITYTGEL